MKSRISVITLLWITFGAHILYAQQPHTEHWFSFGENYISPFQSQDTVIYGSASSFKIQITSLHRAKGFICFTRIKDSVPFSVQPYHVFSYTLTPRQILACYHTFKDTGVTDGSVRVTCDSSISVSIMAEQPHSSDATQVLPVEAWGTTYRMIRQNGYVNYAAPEKQDVFFIARKDSTKVTANGAFLCTLQRGEVYYQELPVNLSGAVFQSNHPIAFFNAEKLTNIPRMGTSDKSLEQYYPQQTWGREFFVPVTCMDWEFIQVMATEDNTNIQQTGGRLRTDINGVGKLTGLKAGQWAWLEVSSQNNGCFLSADKPVIVCSFMANAFNHHTRGYSDPSVVWVPAVGQRVRQGIVKAYKKTLNPKDSLPPLYYVLVVVPSYGKDSTIVRVNGASPQPLSGGQWKNHPNGYSYYNMPISDSLAYTVSNPFCGLQLYHYGVSQTESYHEQASCKYRNLHLSFYGNDTHHLSLPNLRLCEQEVVFKGEVKDSLAEQAGHIRWYIDSVEVVSARDSLIWKNSFKRGVYHIRMEVCYDDGFTFQSVESKLHIVSLNVQVKTTPEYCRRSDGCMTVHAQSDLPSSLSYILGNTICTDSICDLKSGFYHLKVSDAYCTTEQTVFIDSVQAPLARFMIKPETANVGMKVRFTDQSIGQGGSIQQWHWVFGDGMTASEQHPNHIYAKTLDDSVKLIVSDENNCLDTALQKIHIVDRIAFPNAYAPEGNNGKPLYFQPLEEKGPYRGFEMIIYNRWGNMIWSQHCKGDNCPDYADETFWWNGKDTKGSDVSAGVYFWVVKATFDSSLPPLTTQGSVTVFR